MLNNTKSIKEDVIEIGGKLINSSRIKLKKGILFQYLTTFDRAIVIDPRYYGINNLKKVQIIERSGIIGDLISDKKERGVVEELVLKNNINKNIFTFCYNGDEDDPFFSIPTIMVPDLYSFIKDKESTRAIISHELAHLSFNANEYQADKFAMERGYQGGMSKILSTIKDFTDKLKEEFPNRDNIITDELDNRIRYFNEYFNK